MNKFIISCLMLVAFSATAWAQATYDIKEMTPAVKAALESRRARFENLKALKAQRFIGENNQGYVQVLTGGPATKEIADAENADRSLIYRTIVKQNDLPSKALKTVEEVFAGVQRDKAASGDQIQTPEGDWVAK